MYSHLEMVTGHFGMKASTGEIYTYTKVWQPYKLSLQLFSHTNLTDMHNLLSIIGNSQLTFPSKEMCMWKERTEFFRKKIDGKMTLKGVNARQTQMGWNRDVKRNNDGVKQSRSDVWRSNGAEHYFLFFFLLPTKTKVQHSHVEWEQERNKEN